MCSRSALSFPCSCQHQLPAGKEELISHTWITKEVCNSPLLLGWHHSKTHIEINCQACFAVFWAQPHTTREWLVLTLKMTRYHETVVKFSFTFEKTAWLPVGKIGRLRCVWKPIKGSVKFPSWSVFLEPARKLRRGWAERISHSEDFTQRGFQHLSIFCDPGQRDSSFCVCLWSSFLSFLMKFLTEGSTRDSILKAKVKG